MNANESDQAAQHLFSFCWAQVPNGWAQIIGDWAQAQPWLRH